MGRLDSGESWWCLYYLLPLCLLVLSLVLVNTQGLAQGAGAGACMQGMGEAPAKASSSP